MVALWVDLPWVKPGQFARRFLQREIARAFSQHASRASITQLVVLFSLLGIERGTVQKHTRFGMEDAFGYLPLSSNDDRLVCLHGRVLTARRLGNVLFLSTDNISQFNVYSADSSKEHNLLGSKNDESDPGSSSDESDAERSDSETAVGRDVFVVVESLGTSLQISMENVILQVVLAKESFKGEVQVLVGEEGSIEINKSLKQLARKIAMGHLVGIFQ
jgi:hypothetical protein